MDPNEALKRTVREFLGRETPPHYGLLITGEWGSGKTHVIKGLIGKPSDDPPSFYVSLSGCSSKADFDQALFSAVYRHLNHPFAQLIGTAIRATTNADAADFKRFLSTKQQGAYVFDDLERANGLSLIDLLRYVNELVEHSTARVIVVANPDVLGGTEFAEFNAQKEKTVGRTLKVVPDLDSAFDCFVTSVSSEPVRALFRREAAAIKDIFRAAGRHEVGGDGQPRLKRNSGFNNLRTLQQALWDIEEILKTQRGFEDAEPARLRAFVEYVLVMALHVKNGNLSEEDLPEDRKSVLTRRMHNTRAGFEFDHPEVDLETVHMRRSALANALFRGHFDPIAIGEDFRRTVTPPPAADTPPWRVLIESFERPAEEVRMAVERLHEQFANFEIVELGEILHAVSLRLWLADIGAIDESAQEVQGGAIAYIDQLVQRDKLPAYDESHTSRRFVSYGGWQIMEHELLGPVRDHLQAQAQVVQITQLDEKGHELLGALPKAPADVGSVLVGAGNPHPNYGHLPIMRHVDPVAFTAALLSLPVPEQHKIGMAIHARYDFGSVRYALRAEETFVRGLDKAIEDAIGRSDLSPIETDRLKKLRRWSLSKAIEHFDTLQETE